MRVEPLTQSPTVDVELAGLAAADSADRVRGRRRHSRAEHSSTVDDLPVVARHVTRMPACASPEQAVLALDQLGQEFGLHVDTATGREAIVWRNPDGECGFRTDRSTLTETEAIQRLVLTGEPWLFYTDHRTGRGHVAHRRADHRYGVVTP